MMERLNNIITTYQQKICHHDRQIWEQSCETDLFKKLKNVPRKAAKINTSLIDVDLFRGSVFSMSKSQSSWLSIVILAWLRLIFFPVYYRWWMYSTCRSVFGLLCILYVFQLGSLVVLYLDFQQLRSIETLTLSDFITPYVMMYVLTVMHSLITANYNFPVRHSMSSSNGKRSEASVIQSFQARVSESQLKSDQMTGKRSKVDSQNSLHKKKKQFVSTGASNTSFASQDLSDKIVFESEVMERNENLINPVSSATDQLSSGSLDFSPSEVFRNDPSQIESFNTIPDSEFDNTQSRNADDLAHVSGVDYCQSEDSKVGSVQSSPSNTAESVLTVVGSSFDEASADVKSDNYVAKRQEILYDEIKSRTVPGIFTAEMQGQVFSKSSSKYQEEIDERVDSVRTTSNVRTDDEATRYFLSKLKTSFTERSEIGNIVDSNTSMSDTCNSSFVSSADEDDRDVVGVGACAARARNFSTVRDKKFSNAEFIPSVQFGVRQRRKLPENQTQSPVKRSPHRTFENIHISQHENPDIFSHLEKRNQMVLETADQDPSSDDEEVLNLKHGLKLRGSHLRQTVTRKSCLSCQRKAETDSADETACVDPSFSQQTQDSLQFGAHNGTWDLNGCEKRTRSLPFVKNVLHPDYEEASNDCQSPLHRTSATSGQSGSENSSCGQNNATGNTAKPLPTGFVPSSLMNCITSATDKVSCVMWSTGGAVHKVDLTIFDIGWTIVRTVDAQQERCDYMMLGILLSFVITCMPTVYRLYQHPDRDGRSQNCTYANSTVTNTPSSYAGVIFGSDTKQSLVLVNGMIQRLFLSLLFFFLLSVAERTFKQKFLYAKNFCYLTSSRKAKKYNLPHFRLNKVRNIKTWLSLRSFLKKRGPQRSVESIVSSSFVLAVILVSILCIELLQDYGHFLEHLGNWELVLWSMVLGIYLLRFITLGTKINKKYRNLSILITEQINLYLHMEQKPHKKAALVVASSVLKLAEGLLKELESPFKISGLSANPFLYNITKVVILSAFSAVLTELLGFKLKLYKIKIRS